MFPTVQKKSRNQKDDIFHSDFSATKQRTKMEEEKKKRKRKKDERDQKRSGVEKRPWLKNEYVVIRRRWSRASASSSSSSSSPLQLHIYFWVLLEAAFAIRIESDAQIQWACLDFKLQNIQKTLGFKILNLSIAIHLIHLCPLYISFLNIEIIYK